MRNSICDIRETRMYCVVGTRFETIGLFMNKKDADDCLKFHYGAKIVEMKIDGTAVESEQ